jgi:hypothetical protein
MAECPSCGRVVPLKGEPWPGPDVPMCSPLSCSAWDYVAVHDKEIGWVLTDEEAERRAPHDG